MRNTHAHKQQLASVQMNEQMSELVGVLREEKWALAIKQESLESQIQELQK